MHFRDGAIRVCREVQQIVGKPERVSDRVRRWIGMHENHRLAALELREDRLQDGVSEVHSVRVREDHEPVEAEHVAGVCYFVQRRVDIG